MMEDFEYRECPYFSEDYDMGKTIPICGKDGFIWNKCSEPTFNFQASDEMLLLLLMAFNQQSQNGIDAMESKEEKNEH